MIKFSEIISSYSDVEKNRKDSENLTEIKHCNVDSANQFWDELMESPTELYELTEEEIFDEIYGIDEDHFNFNFETPLNQEFMKKLDDLSWLKFEEKEKKAIVEEIKDCLVKELDLSRIPEISYYDGSAYDCGSYDSLSGNLEINQKLLNDPKELVDTLAHEMRHAYQHERADIQETYTDFLYQMNFDNYISPVQLKDDKYLFYTDYYDQYVEVEARAYAKSFTEAVWRNE